MDNIYEELAQSKFINDNQYEFLEAVRTNKIVSLYYELRLVLYLGIMLFAGGVGYFAYQNLGKTGHLLCMAFIGAAIAVGFYFIRRFAQPYSNTQVVVNHIYFDYILVLVSLLIISLFAYIQVYFGLVELLLNWTSFISAAILLLMAYRYDNKAILAMGITALAAGLGVSITPVDWTTGQWTSTTSLYAVSILLGVFLVVVSEVTYRYGIKQHFRFTWQNFGLLLFYMGYITAIVTSSYKVLHAAIALVSSGILTYYTWKKKEFLFFLYSNIVFYIAVSYLLYKIVEWTDNNSVFEIYYLPLTCINYIVFLIQKKSHFSHD